MNIDERIYPYIQWDADAALGPQFGGIYFERTEDLKQIIRDVLAEVKPPVLMTLDEVTEANKNVPTPLSTYVYHESKGYLDAISKMEDKIKELGL